LLDRGNETVSVFPEETVTDSMGNIRTRASETGITVKATVQPLTFTEDNSVGFDTGLGTGYGSSATPTHSGHSPKFNGSRKTGHVDYDYVMVRK
jgi:hypothetical protein